MLQICGYTLTCIYNPLQKNLRESHVAILEHVEAYQFYVYYTSYPTYSSNSNVNSNISV